jgi:hypothetical protein
VIAVGLVILLEWFALLALLPLVTLLRTMFWTPWTVEARRRGGPRPRERYSVSIRGWRASAAAIEAIRRDIQQFGVPRSLGLPELDSHAASEVLDQLRDGVPVVVEGRVHGFASPFAERGWLSGYLRADAYSLVLGQDETATAGRRHLPLPGPTDFTVREPTGEEADVIGTGWAVAAFAGRDGRPYRVAIRDAAALGWLVDAWRAAAPR